MYNNFKRLLSLVLAFTMVLTSVPVNVFAEDALVVEGDHNYVITETKDASCTEGASVTYTCSGCGSSYIEIGAANGHSHEVTETVDATCTEAGYTAYTCAACGDNYKEEIAATGPTLLKEHAPYAVKPIWITWLLPARFPMKS